jgi:hypothetical protein
MDFESAGNEVTQMTVGAYDQYFSVRTWCGESIP